MVSSIISANTFTVSIEGALFEFNRKKLYEESKYFKGMFSGSFAESNSTLIELTEIGIEEFQLFSHWLNYGRSNFRGITRELLARLLVLADRLMVDNLLSECIKEIRRRLNLSTQMFSSIFLETAIMIGDNDLKETIIDWFKTTIAAFPVEFGIHACLKSEKSLLSFMASPECQWLKETQSEEANTLLEDLMNELQSKLAETLPELMKRKKETQEELRKHVESKPSHREQRKYTIYLKRQHELLLELVKINVGSVKSECSTFKCPENTSTRQRRTSLSEAEEKENLPKRKRALSHSECC